MLPILEEALISLSLEPADAPTVELARAYAMAIDDGEALKDIGPKLLSCLEALGMSPRARQSIAATGEADRGTNPLDELRSRRASRQHSA